MCVVLWYLSHGRSRISSSDPEISCDQTWSTVTSGNNPESPGSSWTGKNRLYIKKRVNKRFKTWKTWKRECEIFWLHTIFAFIISMTVNISTDAKPIKNIKMADSNTLTGKVGSHLFLFTSSSVFLSQLVGYVVFHVTFHGGVTQESSAFFSS